ncbi:IPT/TIG domain-containing protein [Arthrobacter sp. UCD-GKA]|uniref:IPT/TIG domain-containing protein n=1 Tax=Arthrobacter sp. UCD-GKA TaxID=1913576 RepID=UPI0011132E9A|nr:IPT/TIG domain-containing protein [Arthrobacter sp. UCD-GKA]
MKRLATIALTVSLLFGGSVTAVPAAQAAVSVALPAAKKTVAKTAITTHPRSVTAVKGSTAKFSASSKGHKLKYQWQLKTSKAPAWKNVSGATGKSLTLKKIKTGASKNQYRVRVTGTNGKVTSKKATLTVRNHYKPVVSHLSTTTFEVGRAATLRITGRNFHDVTSITVDGYPAKFKKTGTTRLDLTVPRGYMEESVRLVVSSAAGRVTKNITYFTYLSNADRTTFLRSIDQSLISYGAPAAKVKTIYANARGYIASPKAWEAKAYDQWQIALYALEYSDAIREANIAGDQYENLEKMAGYAEQVGDAGKARQYRTQAAEYAATRDAYNQIASNSLGYIRTYGIKV